MTDGPADEVLVGSISFKVVPVSVSGLDLFLKFGKILPPPVRLRLGSIVEAHGRELKTEYDRGKN